MNERLHPSREQKVSRLEKHPPSVTFFTQTPEGVALKKELKPYVDKLLNATKDRIATSDTHIDTATACSLAEIQYYLGEDYQSIFKTLGTAIDSQKDNVLRLHDMQQIMETRVALKLPRDAQVDSFLSKTEQAFNDGSIKAGTHLGLVRDESKILRDIGIVYLEEGNAKKAYEIASLIPDPAIQAQLLLECTKIENHSGDRTELITSIINSSLDRPKAHKDTLYRLACHNLASIGNLQEAKNYAHKISDTNDKVEAFLVLSQEATKHGDALEASLAVEEAEKVALVPDSENDEVRNNIMRVAAFYVNNSQPRHAESLIAKVSGDYNHSSFIGNIDLEKIYTDPITQDCVFKHIASSSFIASEKNSTDRVGGRTLAGLGLFNKALENPQVEKLQALLDAHPDLKEELRQETLPLTAHLKAPGLLRVFKGINDYAQLKERQGSNFSPISMEKLVPRIAHRDDVAFGMSRILPDDFDTSQFPEHIQLAFALGKKFAHKDTDFEQTLPEYTNPLAVRSFLRGMESFDFTSIPEAMESILGTLPNEADRAIYDYIEKNPESAPRFVKTLISLDAARGTRYAMNFIARKSTPDKIFTYFAKVFVNEGKFTKKLEPFLSDPTNTPHLRRLVAQHPNQFNNTIDALSKLSITSFDKEPLVWNALNEISPISPIIYSKYRNLSELERKTFVTWLQNFDYSEFFQNKPIKYGELSVHDAELETDLLFRAYNPVNMSFETVAQLLPNIPDRTDDLKNYNIQDHYDATFKTPTFTLKKGEFLDKNNLSKIHTITKSLVGQSPQFSKKTEECIVKLTRATSDFTDQEVSELMSIMTGHEQLTTTARAFSEPLHQLHYQELLSAKEMLGIFVKDNFTQDVTRAMEENPMFGKRLDKVLNNPERRQNLLAALGYRTENELTQATPTLNLVAELFSEKVLGRYTTLINREVKKFKQTESETDATKKARVFISKNRGSFFAKSTAGICTAGDTALWNYPNHFHINTVDETNTVRGNTMGYLETINNRRALVLRGFNPTENYLTEISAESYVKEMFTVAKQFMADNDIQDLYIPGPDEFSALSNRSGVKDYLNKFFRHGERTPHPLKLSGAMTGSFVWKIE